MTGIDGNYVFLQLASGGSESSMVNRIALKCDSVSVDTSKNVLAFPVPGSGFLTGESQAVGIDLGMATKTIQLDGVITEQFIQKDFGSGAFGSGSETNQEEGKLSSTTDFSHGRGSGTAPTNSTGYVNVKMRPHEVAQLIHSHVDSSIIQPHQNLNELVILIPSYVGIDYHYQGSCSISSHTNRKDCESAGGTWTAIATDANSASALSPTDGKLVPFNWGVRYHGASGNSLDNKYTIINTSKFDGPYGTQGSCSIRSHTTQQDCESAGGTWTPNVKGVKGFVRSFNTSFTEQPYITFSLNFEVAITGL